jgi:hypothetical protein
MSDQSGSHTSSALPVPREGMLLRHRGRCVRIHRVAEGHVYYARFRTAYPAPGECTGWWRNTIDAYYTSLREGAEVVE